MLKAAKVTVCVKPAIKKRLEILDLCLEVHEWQVDGIVQASAGKDVPPPAEVDG